MSNTIVNDKDVSTLFADNLSIEKLVLETQDEIAESYEKAEDFEDSDEIDGIKFVNYRDESDLASVMALVGRDLSEPYSSKYYNRNEFSRCFTLFVIMWWSIIIKPAYFCRHDT